MYGDHGGWAGLGLDTVQAQQRLSQVEEELADEEVDARLRVDLLVEHLCHHTLGISLHACFRPQNYYNVP